MLAALLATGSAVGGTVDPTAPRPYWEAISGCDHGHRSQVAKRRIARLLRAPYVRRQAVRHYTRCVETRAKRRYLTREVVKPGWRWRKAHYWSIRLERLPASWRAWARSTSACESDYPSQHGNGGMFHGSFQFMLGTWWSAGGTGDPHTKSYEEQAVIAIGLAMRDGTGHWPVCG